ncbi:hypothetical protein GCM10023115_11120 [Pontixanthobacter gangjinensis]|uniref:DUF4153 domain-containing protein n=1 Tax=Pontixanthobacter gangjinensis TaxID=1028742 RepID=A0A6I4SLP6_9SPHN|nr:DUF4153 domain-containing protein [Pontixanthobacter gangjinensis]MXO56358.1 DUF4153 domain-containing protein [Pontixanthobacter gangjinensis]
MNSSDTSPANKPAMPDDWPLRPWVLTALLGLAGLAVHFASDGGEDVPWRMALTAFFFFGSGIAAFTIDRDYRIPPAIYALICGVVMAGIAWRVTSAGDRYGDEAFWLAAGLLAVTLSLPLFQAGFHLKRFATPYSDTHYFVWTDAISGAGALAFTGLSWLVLALLASLFELLKIDVLSDLMSEGWFGWMFSGAAFGAALGVLRNQIKILATMQSVVLLVLSLLAVPLAIALVLFLLSMLVSGPNVLWEATRSATPILLGCAVGAFLLANAVLRDDDADMSPSRIQRWAALVLVLGIFPLTAFAAVSMGTRIAQHGLSPERIWALIAIAVATAFGLAYLVSAIRGRKAGWRDYLRQSNLHLAVGVSVLALLLALPIFNFGAISVSNQLARLESGAVSAEDFDYSALRWDFGDAGRAALAKLAKSDDAERAKGAKIALAEEYRRYRRVDAAEASDERKRRLANLRIDIEDPALRERVELRIASQQWSCEKPCIAIEQSVTGNTHKIALIEGGRINHLFIDPTEPLAATEITGSDMEAMEDPDYPNLPPPQVTARSKVEIREWTGKRIYVDGKPLGEPFE